VATVLCIYLPYLNETFLRVISGMPVVLFVPGCALIATLFPGAKDTGVVAALAIEGVAMLLFMQRNK
jgi:uncharacterized membrane protein